MRYPYIPHTLSTSGWLFNEELKLSAGTDVGFQKRQGMLSLTGKASTPEPGNADTEFNFELAAWKTGLSQPWSKSKPIQGGTISELYCSGS